MTILVRLEISQQSRHKQRHETKYLNLQGHQAFAMGAGQRTQVSLTAVLRANPVISSLAVRAVLYWRPFSALQRLEAVELSQYHGTWPKHISTKLQLTRDNSGGGINPLPGTCNSAFIYEDAADQNPLTSFYCAFGLGFHTAPSYYKHLTAAAPGMCAGPLTDYHELTQCGSVVHDSERHLCCNDDAIVNPE